MTTPKRPTREGPPIALGLCRVSTEEQADSGAGMGAQKDALEAEADRKAWVLELVLEAGVSAKDMRRRPILLDTLARLDAGEADILAVSKLDRLSRSVIDFATILERARKGGWAVVALDLGVDTSTPTGELVAGVMMQVAQWERRIIGQRTKDALKAKKAAGVRLGRPDALDASTRARIVSERISGRSYRAIADGLAEDGIPTAQGGTLWRASSVRAILASQAAAEPPRFCSLPDCLGVVFCDAPTHHAEEVAS